MQCRFVARSVLLQQIIENLLPLRCVRKTGKISGLWIQKVGAATRSAAIIMILERSIAARMSILNPPILLEMRMNMRAFANIKGTMIAIISAITIAITMGIIMVIIMGMG